MFISNCEIKKASILQIASTLLIILITSLFFYNIYTLFFPISHELGHDEAEHLHVAHLLSVGETPFVDFIENHPTLYNHYLGWLSDFFNISSTREWALYARATIFIHFIFCILAFWIWVSRLIKIRPTGLRWGIMLLACWFMMDLLNPSFMAIWEFRPDFICYALTLWGCFLFYYWMTSHKMKLGPYFPLLPALGGAMVGWGNAILPKGIVFIIAFALTFIFSGFINGNFFPPASARRKLIIGGFIFLTVSLFSFLSAMLLDCHLSKISLEKWLAGVFLINSRKHIIYSLDNDNPIQALLNTLPAPFIVTFIFVFWFIWEFSYLKSPKNQQHTHQSLWFFIVFTISTNLLLPSYSNGVTWAYNYIPSLFAVASLFILLFLRLWYSRQTKPLTLQPSFRLIGTCAIIVFFVLQVSNYTLNAFEQYNYRKKTKTTIRKTYPLDFMIEETMPASFTYLTRSPNRIPVRSRHWGFHFMLWRDHKFWPDCHSLGIGPEPQKIWAGFGKNKPDAIAFSSLPEVFQFVTIIRLNHGVNAGWLLSEIRDHYILMSHKGVSLFIRSDNVSSLEKNGWHKRPFQKNLFSGMVKR